MARARNIKPGLYKNEDLAECSIWARYIFPGMWMLADREGRMEDRPKRIKGELLPYDSVEIDSLLEELAAFGFIVRYSVNCVRYIQIAKFSEHQTPHVREQPSTIPGPEHADKVQSTAKVVTKHCLGSDESSPRSPDSLIPSSLIPDSPNTYSTPPAKVDEYTEQFEEAWKAYPQRPGASKIETLKAWNARIKAGASPEDMVSGVKRYADYVIAMKTEPKYIKQPATFFGPSEFFKSDWTVAQPRASPHGHSSLGKAGQATAAAAQRLLEQMEHEQAI